MDEGVGVMQMALAFLIVLGMIGIFALALKKFSAPSGMLAKMRKDARLQLLDICLIDQRHKVVLFRCDRTEYVALLSPEGQTVVDQWPGKEEVGGE